MTAFRSWRALCLLIFASTAALANVIVGFEDEATLKKVMDGEILMQDVVSTKTEFRTVGRAFFNHVAPDAYMALAVNHPKYPDLFEEVKKGETLKVSEDRMVFDYRLDILFKMGPFSQHVYPEGTQKLIPITGAMEEGRIENVITNYQDTLKTTTQTTRLIPYQTGMLVHDDIHVVLKEATSASSMVKKELKKYFSKYLTVFRKELHGNY